MLGAILGIIIGLGMIFAVRLFVTILSSKKQFETPDQQNKWVEHRMALIIGFIMLVSMCVIMR